MLASIFMNTLGQVSTAHPHQWTALAPGLELLRTRATLSPLSAVILLRIDPQQYTFRVHYQPGQPQSLRRWQAQHPDVAALLNTSFYDETGHAIGRLISDGSIYGETIHHRGGVFVVSGSRPVIRYNPTLSGEVTGYDQAVQAFPMLVHGGQAIYTDRSSDRVTRRSAIATDTSGQVILVATPLLGVQLADLAAFLASPWLRITEAFNLDGGSSTMLYAAGEHQHVSLPSLNGVPSVLGVYPKVSSTVLRQQQG